MFRSHTHASTSEVFIVHSLTFLAGLVILFRFTESRTAGLRKIFFFSRMIVAKKSLGQNFLRDENVARNIVASLGVRADDAIVEIGPGAGALTKHLIATGAPVIGIEVDVRAAQLLRETFGDALTLVRADVLDVNLAELAGAKRQQVRIIGNIPYYITSEILFWLFDHRSVVRDATLMMQREVAQRLVARPKTKAYGILAVATQFHTEPELLFKVSRNSFYPTPNVDSAVVRLNFKQTLPACNIQLFTGVVRSTFGKRRKTLRNGLRYMGFSDEQLDGIDFDFQQRPEELTVNDFLQLTRFLEPYEKYIRT